MKICCQYVYNCYIISRNQPSFSQLLFFAKSWETADFNLFHFFKMEGPISFEHSPPAPPPPTRNLKSRNHEKVKTRKGENIKNDMVPVPSYQTAARLVTKTMIGFPCPHGLPWASCKSLVFSSGSYGSKRYCLPGVFETPSEPLEY